ncbi:MAG: hypothetical protein P8L79_02485 [Rhodospirillaceae bacterium]|nr:hypothetical protein [Rhodospirillaceae bacterium]
MMNIFPNKFCTLQLLLHLNNLEFLGERGTILFAATKHIHGTTFLRGLIDLKTWLVIDLRFAPHSNFAPISANTIQNVMENLGNKYHLSSLSFDSFRSGLLLHNPSDILIFGPFFMPSLNERSEKELQAAELF